MSESETFATAQEAIAAAICEAVEDNDGEDAEVWAHQKGCKNPELTTDCPCGPVRVW